MCNSGVSLYSLLPILFLAIIASLHHNARFVNAVAADNGTSIITPTPMVPLNEAKMMMMMESVILNHTRRRLNSFRICAICTCCGGPKGLCVPSPCCYALNCNVPNRPFGICAFTPKTCNCFGCHL